MSCFSLLVEVFLRVCLYDLNSVRDSQRSLCRMETHCDILHSLGENKQVSFQVGKYCSQCQHEGSLYSYRQCVSDLIYCSFFIFYFYSLLVLGVVQTCISYM